MVATHPFTAVIMAGGAGTRFWPLSTERVPKQFLKLLGERTLLQQTVDRMAPLLPAEQIFVFTAEAFVDLVKEQLPQLPAENIIGEPLRRDTAAAIALAAFVCQQRLGSEMPMAVLPADHHIAPDSAYQTCLQTLVAAAREHCDALYTLGIRPTEPATGYGYLECGPLLGNPAGIAEYQLTRFHEKPDRRTAEAYLSSGKFFWNSGIFVWTVAAIVAQIQRHLPAHAERLSAVAATLVSEPDPAARSTMLREALLPLPRISIDYGVMEKSSNVRCLIAPFCWSDVGGWSALDAFLAHDAAGNAIRGQIYGQDATDNVVFCEDAQEHVALVGVQNLIVVRVGNRTLVADRAHAEEIKALVQRLPADLQ